jgi:hypothetical protein
LVGGTAGRQTFGFGALSFMMAANGARTIALEFCFARRAEKSNGYNAR